MVSDTPNITSVKGQSLLDITTLNDKDYLNVSSQSKFMPSNDATSTQIDGTSMRMQGSPGQVGKKGTDPNSLSSSFGVGGGTISTAAPTGSAAKQVGYMTFGSPEKTTTRNAQRRGSAGRSAHSNSSRGSSGGGHRRSAHRSANRRSTSTDPDSAERSFIYPCQAFKQFLLTVREGKIDMKDLSNSPFLMEYLAMQAQMGGGSGSSGADPKPFSSQLRQSNRPSTAHPQRSSQSRGRDSSGGVSSGAPSRANQYQGRTLGRNPRDSILEEQNEEDGAGGVEPTQMIKRQNPKDTLNNSVNKNGNRGSPGKAGLGREESKGQGDSRNKQGSPNKGSGKDNASKTQQEKGTQDQSNERSASNNPTASKDINSCSSNPTNQKSQPTTQLQKQNQRPYDTNQQSQDKKHNLNRDSDNSSLDKSNSLSQYGRDLRKGGAGSKNMGGGSGMNQPKPAEESSQADGNLQRSNKRGQQRPDGQGNRDTFGQKHNVKVDLSDENSSSPDRNNQSLISQDLFTKKPTLRDVNNSSSPDQRISSNNVIGQNPSPNQKDLAQAYQRDSPKKTTNPSLPASTGKQRRKRGDRSSSGDDKGQQSLDNSQQDIRFDEKGRPIIQDYKTGGKKSPAKQQLNQSQKLNESKDSNQDKLFPEEQKQLSSPDNKSQKSFSKSPTQKYQISPNSKGGQNQSQDFKRQKSASPDQKSGLNSSADGGRKRRGRNDRSHGSDEAMMNQPQPTQNSPFEPRSISKIPKPIDKEQTPQRSVMKQPTLKDEKSPQKGLVKQNTEKGERVPTQYDDGTFRDYKESDDNNDDQKLPLFQKNTDFSIVDDEDYRLDAFKNQDDQPKKYLKNKVSPLKKQTFKEDLDSDLGLGTGRIIPQDLIESKDDIADDLKQGDEKSNKGQKLQDDAKIGIGMMQKKSPNRERRKQGSKNNLNNLSGIRAGGGTQPYGILNNSGGLDIFGDDPELSAQDDVDPVQKFREFLQQQQNRSRATPVSGQGTQDSRGSKKNIVMPMRTDIQQTQSNEKKKRRGRANRSGGSGSSDPSQEREKSRPKPQFYDLPSRNLDIVQQKSSLNLEKCEKLSSDRLSIQEHIDTYRSKTSSQILRSARKELPEQSPYNKEDLYVNPNHLNQDEDDYPYVSSTFKPPKEDYSPSTVRQSPPMEANRNETSTARKQRRGRKNRDKSTDDNANTSGNIHNSFRQDGNKDQERQEQAYGQPENKVMSRKSGMTPQNVGSPIKNQAFYNDRVSQHGETPYGVDQNPYYYQQNNSPIHYGHSPQGYNNQSFQNSPSRISCPNCTSEIDLNASQPFQNFGQPSPHQNTSYHGSQQNFGYPPQNQHQQQAPFRGNQPYPQYYKPGYHQSQQFQLASPTSNQYYQPSQNESKQFMFRSHSPHESQQFQFRVQSQPSPHYQQQPSAHESQKFQFGRSPTSCPNCQPDSQRLSARGSSQPSPHYQQQPTQLDSARLNLRGSPTPSPLYNPGMHESQKINVRGAPSPHYQPSMARSSSQHVLNSGQPSPNYQQNRNASNKFPINDPSSSLVDTSNLGVSQNLGNQLHTVFSGSESPCNPMFSPPHTYTQFHPHRNEAKTPPYQGNNIPQQYYNSNQYQPPQYYDRDGQSTKNYNETQSPQYQNSSQTPQYQNDGQTPSYQNDAQSSYQYDRGQSPHQYQEKTPSYYGGADAQSPQYPQQTQMGSDFFSNSGPMTHYYRQQMTVEQMRSPQNYGLMSPNSTLLQTQMNDKSPTTYKSQNLTKGGMAQQPQPMYDNSQYKQQIYDKSEKKSVGREERKSRFNSKEKPEQKPKFSNNLSKQQTSTSKQSSDKIKQQSSERLPQSKQSQQKMFKEDQQQMQQQEYRQEQEFKQQHFEQQQQQYSKQQSSKTQPQYQQQNPKSSPYNANEQSFSQEQQRYSFANQDRQYYQRTNVQHQQQFQYYKDPRGHGESPESNKLRELERRLKEQVLNDPNRPLDYRLVTEIHKEVSWTQRTTKVDQVVQDDVNFHGNLCDRHVQTEPVNLFKLSALSDLEKFKRFFFAVYYVFMMMNHAETFNRQKSQPQ